MKRTAAVLAVLCLLTLSAFAADYTAFRGQVLTSVNGATAAGVGDSFFIVPNGERLTAADQITWQVVMTSNPTAITTNLEGSMDAVVYSDGAITAAATTFTSSLAGFTATDVGKEIIITGAGAAGANLKTVIDAVTNATTVTVHDAAGTTVKSASFEYGHWQMLDQNTNTVSTSADQLARSIVSKNFLRYRCNVSAFTPNGAKATCQILVRGN